jgi:phage tail sheath protein FI
VTLNGDNALVEARIQPAYYLYDSLRLFFMNGGGNCYIVSVGTYDTPVEYNALNVGLSEIARVDEPTMLLFPDATLITDSELYDLQRNALRQCNDLKDRVAILDLRPTDQLGVEFRNHVGTENLKYGAAYTPHLRTSLGKNIRYKSIRNTTGHLNRFTRAGAPITLSHLTTDAVIQGLISNLDTAVNDVELIEGELNTLLGTTLQGASFSVPDAQSQDLRRAFDYLHSTATTDNTEANYTNVIDFLYEVITTADGWLWDTTSTSHTSSGTDSYQVEAQANVFPAFDNVVTSLIAFDKGASHADVFGATNFPRFLQAPTSSNNYANRIDPSNYAASWTDADPPSADTTRFGAGTVDTMRSNSLPTLVDLFEQLLATINSLVTLANSRMKNFEDSLLEQFPTYKNLVQALNRTLCTLPPSSTIAGVYAQVDRNRGVWKPPANVSLNGVADLTYHFTQPETDDLNVDTNAGKSINAIQFFTGRGFMVWGARTLAGNDNEWRYISVRRFFNMVEESVKKSTQWAVFEPNDASTWIRVKGMIENFLTLQWRDGALQGAKPEDAFFVKVGLGETMTQLDILEGRMNVEIGMAVVRPAEFIILTFSHMMATS